MPEFIRRGIGALAAGGVGLVLSGCAAAEPASDNATSKQGPLVIAVITDTEDSTEQMVLGELYQQAFEDGGRESVVDILPAAPDQHAATRLGESRADMMIGCTGDLLEAYYPSAAADIADSIAAAEDREAAIDEHRQQTYDELVGVLPSQLDAPNPSPAEGCGAEETGMPQNIVPIFYTASLSRADRQDLNALGRSLTTEDIEEMVDTARENGSVSAAVQDYFEGSGSLPGGAEREPADAS